MDAINRLALLCCFCLACGNGSGTPLGIRRPVYPGQSQALTHHFGLTLCQWSVGQNSNPTLVGLCRNPEQAELSLEPQSPLQLLSSHQSFTFQLSEHIQLDAHQWSVDASALDLLPHQGELVLLDPQTLTCIDFLAWGGSLPPSQSLRSLCMTTFQRAPERAQLRPVPYPGLANTALQLGTDGQVGCAPLQGNQLTALPPQPSPPCPLAGEEQEPPFWLTEMTSSAHEQGMWLELQANPNSSLFAQPSNGQLDLTGLRLCQGATCFAITQPPMILSQNQPIVLSLGGNTPEPLPAHWIKIPPSSGLFQPGSWQEIALYAPQDRTDGSWPLWAYGAFRTTEQPGASDFWPSPTAQAAIQANLWPPLAQQPLLPLAPTWPKDSLAKDQNNLALASFAVAQASPAAPNLAGEPTHWPQCSTYQGERQVGQASPWQLSKLEFFTEKTLLQLRYVGEQPWPAQAILQLRRADSDASLPIQPGEVLFGEQRLIVLSMDPTPSHDPSTIALQGQLPLQAGGLALLEDNNMMLYLAWQVDAGDEPLPPLGLDAIAQGKWPGEGCRIPRTTEQTLLWQKPGSFSHLPQHYAFQSPGQ